MIRALALDLDDTLLLERDYVRSGFRAVDACLRQRFGERRDWFAELWRGFESGVRGDAFNRVLTTAGVAMEPGLIDGLVRCYREHRPDVAPCPDAVEALRQLAWPRHRVGVITDGPVAMQQRKFEALGLEAFVGHVIYTDAWGVEFRKPHPRAFEEFERWAGCRGAECAYVSDNPAKDFRSPRARGWRTIRVRRAEGLHVAAASVSGEVDVELPDFRQLPDVLTKREN
jgi:putative hydrolase of the HAD superfamily